MTDSGHAGRHYLSAIRGMPGPGYRFVTFRVGGHPRREDLLKYVDRGLTDTDDGIDLHTALATGQSVDLPTELYRDADFFAAVDSNTDRVTVTKSAKYEITAQVTAKNDTVNAATTLVVVTKNGANPTLAGAVHRRLAGYLYTRHSGRPEDTCTLGPAIVSLDANDYLVLSGVESSGSGTCKTIWGGTGMLVKVVSYDPSTADAQLGGRQVADFDAVIESVTVSKAVSGSTGTTEVDILRNGVSITGSLRLILGPTDNYLRFDAAYLDSTTVQVGDEFALVFASDETPFARDIIVQMRCRLKGRP